MLNTKEEIIDWLENYGIGNYLINDDLHVDVFESVYLNSWDLKEVPIIFNNINGNFVIRNNKLTNLDFVPSVIKGYFDCSGNEIQELNTKLKSVSGYFNCFGNKLKNLNGSPVEVGGWFDCSENQITDLTSNLNNINGNFRCGFNKLSSLKGLPKGIKNLMANDNELVSLNGLYDGIWGLDVSNNKLTSLSDCPNELKLDLMCKNNRLIAFKGAPKYIGGRFDCSNNMLETLEYSPIVEMDFSCKNNKLISLVGVQEWVKGFFECSENNLKSFDGGPKKVGSFFAINLENIETLRGIPDYVDYMCILGDLTKTKLLRIDYLPKVIKEKLEINWGDLEFDVIPELYNRICFDGKEFDWESIKKEKLERDLKRELVFSKNKSKKLGKI